MSWDYITSSSNSLYDGQSYNGSATKTLASTTPNEVFMSFANGTMTGTISFDIEGTVSHTQAVTDALESNTNYYVDHMITCTQ